MKLFLKCTHKKPRQYPLEGLEDGVAFELYWAEFDPNDIVPTVGTKHNNGTL